MAGEVTVRPLVADDRKDWGLLYQGYAAFYRVAQDEEMRDRVFGWLMDAAHECSGLGAFTGDKMVGLTHYRPFSSPLRAGINCFLDDLFVDPNARASGAADALIKAVGDVAQANGWPVVRWITADDNYRARGVYDKCATRTMWVTYDMKT